MSAHRFNGRHVTAIVCAVCAAIVLAPLSGFAAGTAPSKVVIVDRSNPSHSAQVSAAGAVSVAGSVTTSPGLPKAPFAETVSNDPVTVPNGKHLVVDTVSVQVDVTSGNNLTAEVNYTTGGVASILFIPLTFAYTSSGYDTYVSTEEVHIADPGSTVTMSVFSPAGTTGTPFLTVSGYLV